jgi:hypothetical protein
MDQLISAVRDWTLWNWCAAWMVFGIVMAILINFLLPTGFLPALIALNRVFLIFVAWWIGRFVSNLIFDSSFLYWVGTVIIFFVFVWIMLRILGDVTAKDLSGGRLAREFVMALIGLVLLYFINQQL